MQKAFSLLEVLLVIASILIILTFAVPKFNNIISNSNITELKSNLAIIRNNISKLKTSQILLNNSSIINSLDDAVINKKDELLFTKLIYFSIVSTNSSINEIGKWIKFSDKSYKYILSSSKNIEFLLEDNIFKCVSNFEICKEIE